MSTPRRQALLDMIGHYKLCFSTESGQRVMNDLVKQFGFTRRSTFVKGDPHETAFNEGARSVLMHIGWYFDVNPDTLTEDATHAQYDEDPDLL